MADHVISNEGTVEDFEAAAGALLSRIVGNFRRPGWDEYFMAIAKVVASRSNCVKRKVASIIVKDKRVISTGYNGTPRGTKNCNEGGCPRCNALDVSGANLEECLCSHAEENALTQAAYHGTSVKDAVLYSTYSPCLLCTKMIINAGLTEVVFNVAYAMPETSIRLLRGGRRRGSRAESLIAPADVPGLPSLRRRSFQDTNRVSAPGPSFLPYLTNYLSGRVLDPPSPALQHLSLG
jgi:dCMP deaminase